MKRQWFAPGAAVVALCLGTASAADDEAIAALAKDYGSLPATSRADLSPDGRFVARRIVHKGAYALRVDPLDGEGRPFVWKPAGDASLDRFSWTGGGTILVLSKKLAVTRARTLDEKAHRSKVYYDVFDALRPQVLDTTGKVIADMTFKKLGDIRTFQPLSDPEAASDTMLVFVQSENAGREGNVFRPAEVSLRKKKFSFIAPPVKAAGNFEFSGDAAGTAMIARRRAFGKTEETVYRRTDGRWQSVDNTFLDQHEMIAVLGPNELLLRQGGTLLTYDIDQAVVTGTVFEGSASAYPMMAPGTGRIVGAWTDSGLEWIDPAEAARHAAAEDIVGQGGLNWSDQSHDGTVRLLRASSSAARGTDYIVSETTGGIIQELTTWPALEDRPRAEIRTIEYKARDGQTIEGYLSAARGADPATLPLVVHPHGGPAARDTLAFDPWREYLTALGFAVFQPNFRGSTGFGAAFAKAGETEWGAAMQDDIVDGVRYLGEEGMANTGRAAIFGASYGGYAALMGTLDDTPYRCAVSLNGVTDLPGMLDVEQIDGSFDYWVGHIGREQLGMAALERRSPLRRVDDIETPILLVHGGLDKTVRKGQSAALEAALIEAGKEVLAVYLMNSDHYLEDEEDRRTAFEEIGTYLADCLR